MQRRDEAQTLITRLIFDDELVHATDYDPVKRREYYLKMRELKGRDKAATPATGGGDRPKFKFSAPVHNRGVVVKNDAHARQQAISVKVGQLKERLGKLKEKLESLREKAKKKDEEKASGGKKTSSTDSKDQKPLTAAEKRKKAADERKRYEKEKKPADKLPETEAELLAEIRKVESRIRAIIAEARKQSNQTDS
jgi:vacuolar-type H+-ATPase subunit I/STV1